MPHTPPWFDENKVVVSNAPTCGINKDGDIQYAVDPETGERSDDEVDNKLLDDVERITNKNFDEGNVSKVKKEETKKSRVLVPNYYDYTSIQNLDDFIDENLGDEFSAMSLNEMQEEGYIYVRSGHGSPSKDQRVGNEVPYVKVSDLRAGRVNINPTNMIPLQLAQSDYWEETDSGLEPFDILSPERASKNIGEFCMLLPGQENIVLTREIIVIRTLEEAHFDQFFLMWALSLEVVMQQWDRIILMQTNREDVGDRITEIKIPIPNNKEAGDEVSSHFRNYYSRLAELRRSLNEGIVESGLDHHFYASWFGLESDDLSSGDEAE